MKNAVSLLGAFACACVLLGACKETASSSSGGGAAAGPVAVCVKEGEQCRYAEGKIGLCTARPDGCDAGAASCLMCMSLH